MIRTAIIVFGLILLTTAGVFFYRNFRGAGPAILPPKPITSSPPSDKALQPGTPEQNLLGLTLPQGFSISIFARGLGGPRVLLYQEFNYLFDEVLHDHQEALLVSLPSEGKVLSLRDLDGDGVAERVKTLISGLNRPHGIALNCGGMGSCGLWVAQSDKVVVYPYTELVKKGVPSGSGTIFKMPDGGNHWSRTIKFSPDGALYISIGSSCNVCLEKDERRAAIYRRVPVPDDQDPSPRIFATGLRNSVFFAWHPKTGKMWATEMGRDLLGDDLPPDEINIIEEGKDYGWPFCYGKNVVDPFGNDPSRCQVATPSHIDLPAHSAPLGLAFVPENSAWPEEYWGDLLVAYHGSWNRSVPTGYKVVRIKLDENGNSEGIEDFITGWLRDDGTVTGRPVDLLATGDGRLYISDDKAGVVYLVTSPTKLSR